MAKPLNIKNKPISKSKKTGKIQVDKDLFITEANHALLVQDIKDLLKPAKQLRDEQADKFESIDKEIYGYLVLDADDTKRARDNDRGYGTKPTDQKLPLTLVQLDEAVTYLLEVISNDGNLYGALAPKDKQAIATGFAALMNEHAVKFGHEVEVGKFFFDAMKYNIGGLIPEWKTIYGNKIKNNTAGQSEVEENAVIYSGNNLTCVDQYNLLYDPSVHPTKIAMEGQFFAIADVYSTFKVRKMASDEEIFNIESFINDNNFTLEYYRQKPTIRTDTPNSFNNSWITLLGGDVSLSSEKVIEFVTLYIWLPTAKYGLDNSDKYSIWRITFANNEHIVRMQKLDNAHAMLPLNIAMPWEDGFREATKSYAELLNPFQQFSSFQLNTHQNANRKALYGLLIYNKSVINLDDNYDPVAGTIPVNAAPDVDIGKAFSFINDVPDTTNTLRDIQNSMEIMQKILPTDILKQVAGLERATQYQAAATVQGANRRNLKIAKVIYLQAFSYTQMMQMYNIYQKQNAIEILTPQGELVEINPSQFRETKIEFSISDGLRGLDKLSMIMHIKDVLNSILQSQQANQQFDVPAIINYWTSMYGDKTDFSQFRIASQMDLLAPEERDLALQVYQQYVAAQEEKAKT